MKTYVHKKDLHKKIQSSLIQDGPKLETTQMIIAKTVDKLWHIHTMEIWRIKN